MGSLLAYSGTTAKIRAMRSRLLTPADYTDLASARNVTEALVYLKKHPGYSILFAKMDEALLHRSAIEKILTNAIYIDFQKVYQFSPIAQRKFLDLYFRRYEVAILKSCMRMVFDHRDVKTNYEIFDEFFSKHSDIRLDRIASSKSTEEFVANLKGSIYYPALARLSSLNAPTLWDYEMAMDLFYFNWFWKNGEKILNKSQIEHFKEAYGTKMDLLNVRWIYRSKHYFRMSPADIYAHLIPVQHHLKKEDIRVLVEAADRNEFAAAVKHTYYGRHYEDYSIDTLDKTYNSIRQNVQRRASKKDPYSAATIISYLYEKEHEINKLTTILEGVRYGLPSNEVLEYIKY